MKKLNLLRHILSKIQSGLSIFSEVNISQAYLERRKFKMPRNQKLHSNENRPGNRFFQRNKAREATKRVTSIPHIIHVLDVNYKSTSEYQEKLRHCSYYEPIKVVLFVWTFLGRLPVWRDTTGDYIIPTFLCVYSSLIGSLIILISGVALRNLARSMLNGESVIEVTKSTEGGYNYTLFWVCLTLVTTYNLSLPFFDWTAASKFLKFLRSWIEYQENYTLKSGRMLRMKHKHRIRFIFCMTLLVNLMTVGFITNYTMKNFDFFSSITTLLAAFEVECRTSFFWHTCAIICDCSEQLSITFCEKGLDSEKSAHRIGDYRRLWLELMDITSSFSDLMSYKMAQLIFISVIFVIVSSYHMALSALSQGVGSSGDIYLYFFCSLYTTVHMLCACEGGYRVSQSLGKKFLDRATHRQLRALAFAEQKEFSLFMSIVRRRSPSILLNGFLKVDRSLIVHVISGSLTYLIILVQFKVGMSEADKVVYKNISQFQK